MFDKNITVRKAGDTYVRGGTTVEKRAPTDESVRLLVEMEQAALNRVLNVWNIQCKDTGLEGVIVELEYGLIPPEYRMGHMAYVVFNINGQPFKKVLHLNEVLDYNLAIVNFRILLSEAVTEFITEKFSMCATQAFKL